MARIGLKDIHIAVMTSESKYDTPVSLAPALLANITPNVSSTTMYGNNRAIHSMMSMGDIDVEIGVSDLNSEQYALLLGKTINEDGVIEDTSKDSSPYVALGFCADKAEGGNRYVWLYKGRFMLPSESHNTKGESIEYQTETITAKFVTRADGKWRARVDSDDENVNPSVIDSWFEQVYEPTSAE
ncbi:major tail protein [Alkalihalophilus marmarensis]|uniref:Phage major tail protein, phi13 family n=1 Tax=Alkalihalophilus marmarensis DSM 21297 TaxID=1188261 RepID=U6SRV3_9BACI|nr:major tail protein [Alkalihalophilus marmarensis]ERN54323.1 hypothetical protein A33I_07855 [Alkalihalophilus marmarensis DSM 21297]